MRRIRSFCCGLKPYSLQIALRGPQGSLFHLRSSDSEGGGQEAEGESDGQVDYLQNSVDGDAYDAKREQEKPDERIGNQSDNGERPAEHEQKAPEYESEHGGDLLLDNCTWEERRKFRAAA
jgi:hypothetical protein